jgi:hypothetical protein
VRTPALAAIALRPPGRRATPDATATWLEASRTALAASRPLPSKTACRSHRGRGPPATAGGLLAAAGGLPAAKRARFAAGRRLLTRGRGLPTASTRLLTSGRALLTTGGRLLTSGRALLASGGTGGTKKKQPDERKLGNPSRESPLYRRETRWTATSRPGAPLLTFGNVLELPGKAARPRRNGAPHRGLRTAMPPLNERNHTWERKIERPRKQEMSRSSRVSRRTSRTCRASPSRARHTP